MITVLVIQQGAERTQRGTGAGTIQAAPNERVVSVGRASAHDYDPLGDDEEHADETPLAVDRQPGTTWSTEGYRDGLAGAGKAGVGLYLDARPGVEAVRMEIQSAEPGWTAEIYAAPPGRVPEGIEDGWTRVGGGQVRSADQRFRLDTGGERYRYYLVWITELPPDTERVEIGELALFERAGR
jgi:serine/threonine-protein kinase